MVRSYFGYETFDLEGLKNKESTLLEMTDKKFYNAFTDVICGNIHVRPHQKYDMFVYLFNLRQMPEHYYDKLLEKIAEWNLDAEIVELLVEEKELHYAVYNIFSKNEAVKRCLDKYLWDRNTFTEKMETILPRDMLLDLTNVYLTFKRRDRLHYLQYMIHMKPKKLGEFLVSELE